MTDTLQETTDVIKKKLEGLTPKAALVLGSGLGELAEEITDPRVIPYEELPDFPRSTVSGHAGRLVAGMLQGTPVLCMQGRIHHYEGLNPAQLAFPVRAFRELGIENLILTNAAGSLRSDMAPGSLMLLSDHINFSGCYPLIGPNEEKWGPRFPDMSKAYAADLRDMLRRGATKAGVPMREGVYVMTAGPAFETPAEVRALNILGGDAVGMSTVPECVAARHCGMKVAAVSVITNFAAGLSPHGQTHAETVETANRAAGNLIAVIRNFTAELSNE